MTRSIAAALLLCLAAGPAPAQAPAPPAGTVPRVTFASDDLRLSRSARPGTPFDKCGRRFAVLGFESGDFEAWAYPLKLFRQFGFSFLIGSSTMPVEGRDIVRFVDVEPAATTLTYTYQSFTVKATWVAAIEEAGAVVLLDVDATEPLTIVASFLPVLQPMWPAGIGGQYAYWDDAVKAYLISEPTRKNHGYVGSPAARGISYTPAHMLSDVPNQFEIRVERPMDFAGRSIPVVMAGGKGARDDVKAVYARLAADPAKVVRDAEAHYAGLRASTLRVRTPDPRDGLALEWAKVALDNLVVDNPDLGRGLVAGLGASGTGGRPGFGWFFGGDASLNSLALNGLGAFETSRQALAFQRKWQRKDGKMAHELSQAAGYLRWWDDYPYAYIHGDTTPYYIAAVDDYLRASGDLAFVRDAWPSLLRAYDWCLTTDEDGDGLMDNRKAGLGALEFGSLTGIRTDIYLAAVWVRAVEAMDRMARAVGDAATAKRVGPARIAALRKTFEDRFWDPERGQYAYAFNADGARVAELTPWSAMPIAWGLTAPDRAAATLARLNAADLTADWGVRMISTRSPLYEPLNYNYGAAWPFLTGWAAAALLRANFVLPGWRDLRANAGHTFDNQLGAVTELLSGTLDVWPQEAVSHQGFSSTGVALPFVRGLLGLDADALARTVAFAPRFPADWDAVAAEGFAAGGARFDFDYARPAPGRIELRVKGENAAGWRLTFAPVVGLGASGFRAEVDGAPAEVRWTSASGDPAAQVFVDVPLAGAERTVRVEFTPGPEPLPPADTARTGDTDRGLKIVRTSLSGQALTIAAEGLAGERYVLRFANPSAIASAEGAEFDGTAATLTFPPGVPGAFLRREVRILLR